MEVGSSLMLYSLGTLSANTKNSDEKLERLVNPCLK